MQAVRRLSLAFETYRNEVARFYGLGVLETRTVSHLVDATSSGPPRSATAWASPRARSPPCWTGSPSRAS